MLGGGGHFSSSPPLLAFVKNVALVNSSLYPASGREGGVTHWVMHRVSLEASTCMGLDASLLEQKMDGQLVSEDYLRTAARVRLSVIPYVDEVFHN